MPRAKDAEGCTAERRLLPVAFVPLIEPRQDADGG